MSRRTQSSGIVRELRAAGWTVTRSGGDHYRATHPAAARPLFFGQTSGDVNQARLVRAQAARLLRAEEGKGS